MRFAATVAYNGTAYKGFQRQSRGLTIQQSIEDVLEVIAGRTVKIKGAGRTDTGVHASGQYIAFDLEWHHPLEKLQTALNSRLASDIAIVNVKHVSEDFDPRRDAISRTYQYQLYEAKVRNPLRLNLAWHVTNLQAAPFMNDAAQSIIGKHDFTSFGLPPSGTNAVRTVTAAGWKFEGNDATFTITADAFLFRMVRSLVGTMVKIGQDKMTVEEFQVILAARKRGLAAAPAPACGLTLTAVNYR
jgi:tRNA pseudouridine38-40 synthase